MQIVVLGMHRSGTSAVTGLLTHMGAYFGPDGVAMPANEANPRGFWERLDVVAANDALLAGAGAAWDTPLRYDRQKVPKVLLEAIMPHMRVIADDLVAHPVSVVKDPRMCLTLADWVPLLRKPVCLFLHRNPLSVARSLQKRGDCSIMTGLALWEAYVRASLRDARSLPLIALDYDRLMADPAAALQGVLAELARFGLGDGLRAPDPATLGEMIHRDLRHHEATREDLAAYATPAQLELFDRLTGGPPAGIPDEPVSRASQDVLLYFADHEKLLQTALQDALIERLAQDRPSLKAISGLQTTTARVSSHREELRRIMADIMAEAEGARAVLQDVEQRGELRAAFWLSRLLRRRGVTIADVHAVAGRLSGAWAAGRDSLENTVDEKPH